MKFNRNVRFAVVGAADAVGPWQARAALQARGAEVVALVDPNTAKLEELAREFPGVALFPTQEALHASGLELDVEILALPTRMHTAAIKAALEAGHDVMCEKPLTKSAAEAAEVIALADRLGRKLHGIGQRRLMMDRIVDAIDEGRIGKPLAVSLRWLRAGAVPPFAFRDPRGAFADLGVHQLKSLLAVPALGAVRSITGAAHRRADELGEFLAHATLRFDGAITATIEVGWSLHPDGGGATPPLEDSVTMQILGTDGTIESTFPTWESEAEGLARHRPTVTRWVGGAMQVDTLGVLPSVDACRIREIEEFVRWVDGGMAPAFPMDEVTVIRVIDGFYASAEAGGALVVIA